MGIDAKVGLFANSEWSSGDKEQRTASDMIILYRNLQGIAHIDGWSTFYSGLR